MSKITIHGDKPHEAITIDESALNAQLVALHVYDPIISLLESLELLGKTKGQTGVNREIAEQSYKHNIARVRKMCGMEQSQQVPQPPKKAEPKRYTNQAYTDEEKATLFD